MAPNKIVIRLLEIILGGLFFYAGLEKLLSPYDFAEAVLAYQLLPVSLVGAAAAVLPWLEIATGLCLAVGFKPRSCLLLLAFLVAGFQVVILITMARGLKIDCGCGLFLPREVGWGAFLGDGVFLLWAVGLYWWELARTGKSEASLITEAAPQR